MDGDRSIAGTHVMTAEQLLQSPGLGRCELIQGELVMMSPSGFEHGRVVMRIAGPLTDFVEERALGVVTGAETGFVIARDPDTVRAPDVGFVRAGRVPKEPMRGFFPGAPDLAVEVLSPDDRAGEVLQKVQDWLGAGCGAVWVVDPEKHTVSIHSKTAPVVVLGPDDELSGGEALASFRLAVAHIFARPVGRQQ